MALHTWVPFCHDFYGFFAQVLSTPCELALAQMPTSGASEVYEINAARPIGPYNLPITYMDHDCESFSAVLGSFLQMKKLLLHLHLLTV